MNVAHAGRVPALGRGPGDDDDDEEVPIGDPDPDEGDWEDDDDYDDDEDDEEPLQVRGIAADGMRRARRIVVRSAGTP